MGDQGEQVLPFYVVCDESYSMADHIDALNSDLQDLHQAVGTDPVVADKTRFCVIGFSGTAEVLLPLSELSDVTEIPGFTPKAATSYIAAFDLLRDTIDRDIAMLKGDGNLVYRPAVFFLSDGQPTDDTDWEPSYRRLTDPGWKPHPNIVAFGIGDADASIIAKVGTFKAFLAKDGINPGAALHEFAAALTKSIIRSVGGMAQQGQVSLQVPEKLEGFTELQVDEV